MAKNKALFNIAILIGALLLAASLFLYREHTQLSVYRNTMMHIGHNLLALRAQVTQDALNHRSDAYLIAASSVDLENEIEAIVEEYNSSDSHVFDFFRSDVENTLDGFCKAALQVTDGIDHLIGLIVVKDSVLTSMVNTVNNSSAGKDNDIQRGVLVKMLNTFSMSSEIQPELASIINTFQEIEKQKQELFTFLLSPEAFEFVEASEAQMVILLAKIRTTIIQLIAITFLIAFFVVLFYISRMKELDRHNKEYQASIDRVTRANEAKSLFLATMSHELRTPMNGVLGMAEIIKGEAKQESTREYAQMIMDSGQHLLTLLNDILDFSKIEQGKMVLEVAPFSIDKVLLQIEHTMKPLAENKQIELSIQNQLARNIKFIGDSSRLHQVLLNLVGNAIKFTDNGKVEIIVQLNSDAPRAILEIEVNDTGIGIDQSKLAHIFNPFEQAEVSTTRKFGGTGLGLSIVKQITDLMNGDITVSSKPDIGTQFKLSLPLPIESALPEIPQTPDNNIEVVQVSDTEPLNILLIENDRISANVIQRFLAPNNHNVIWAKNEHETINALDSESLDLVIAANGISGFSAKDAIKYIRNKLNLDTTIFAYTADLFPQAHEALIEAGAKLVLTKPLQGEELNGSIAKLQKKFSIKGIVKPVAERAAPSIKHSFEDSAITGEEITQSPMLIASKLSNEQTLELLMSFKSKFNSLSKQLLEASEEENIPQQAELLSNINDIATKFGMKNIQALTKTLHDSSMANKSPDAALVKKLVNHIHTNTRQAQYIICSLKNRACSLKQPELQKILIADDHHINVMVLKNLLKTMGYVNIDVAVNGEEAVNFAKQQEYSAIIMDYHMPIMSGLEATKIIKDKVSPNTNVIACTADVSPDATREFLDCGASQVILKPFNKRKLLGALANCSGCEHEVAS